MKSLLKKGIIILIGVAFIAVFYVLFFKNDKQPVSDLSSSVPVENTVNAGLNTTDTSLGSELLSTLLNLKTIKLNDQIFQNQSFTSLRDFTITLVATGTEGRPNPFAPIGNDQAVSPVERSVTTAPATNVTKNTVIFNGLAGGITETFSAWFEWSKTSVSSDQVIKTPAVDFVGGTTSFSSSVSGLLPSTGYTFKAFVKIGTITLSGASVAFTTPAN